MAGRGGGGARGKTAKLNALFVYSFPRVAKIHLAQREAGERVQRVASRALASLSALVSRDITSVSGGQLNDDAHFLNCTAQNQ